MPRRVFYSFHYKPDNWRASQVRNIGAIEGNSPASDNDWETITQGGDAAIKKWIDNQLNGRSCAIVLIGSATANRKWINYEIESAWNANKGVLGIHIHYLKDREGNQAAKGANPFTNFTVNPNGVSLSSVVRTYDPPYYSSNDVYGYIRDNLETWIEEAISIRSKY